MYRQFKATILIFEMFMTSCRSLQVILLGTLLRRYLVVLERMVLKDLMRKQSDEVIICDSNGYMMLPRGQSSHSGCIQSKSSVNIGKSANILSNASASGSAETEMEMPRKRRKACGQS